MDVMKKIKMSVRELCYTAGVRVCSARVHAMYSPTDMPASRALFEAVLGDHSDGRIKLDSASHAISAAKVTFL